jgi:hypothetical protein
LEIRVNEITDYSFFEISKLRGNSKLEGERETEQVFHEFKDNYQYIKRTLFSIMHNIEISLYCVRYRNDFIDKMLLLSLTFIIGVSFSAAFYKPLIETNSFYQSENPSEELMECLVLALPQMEAMKCKDVDIEKIKNIDQDVLNNHPEDLPDSNKKIVCCFIANTQNCVLEIMKQFPGCAQKYLVFNQKQIKENEKYLKTCVPKYENYQNCNN